MAALLCIPTSNELALCCSTSSPTFGVVSVLGFGHSRCVALSYCYFNLQFPNDIWCQAFLCVLYVSLWLGVCSVPFACFLTGSFFLLRAIYLSCWRRQWQPTPVLLPGKSHGWRSLVSYNPWGYKESNMTERLHFHFSLSCIGEGNGNPLQCSCLENPTDRGAWGGYSPWGHKELDRTEYQTTWPASWEICMQVRKQQLELDMEQQTGSK